MGQTITVAAQRGASPGVVTFDCNRSITGMAIERYQSVDDTRGPGRRTCWPGGCSTSAPPR